MSCSTEKSVWNYNSNLVEIITQSAGDCNIAKNVFHSVEVTDSINFDDPKAKLFGLCNEKSAIEKYIKALQVDAELNYNGSFRISGYPVHLISLQGHSQSAVGKEEGFLLIQHKNKTYLIKVFSLQPEAEHIRSFYKNGYILIIKDFNEAYDVPYKKEISRIEYAIVKIEKDAVEILDIKMGEELLENQFKKYTKN
ncbi:hypothetical protein [Pedobacter sp.]|uniref:hypothetical protein n=1 Tax=Pedobacter sp. TaxID=1411316 RepID=UPI00396CA179